MKRAKYRQILDENLLQSTGVKVHFPAHSQENTAKWLRDKSLNVFE
jgi:cobalamin-dependent methionine synthase I